MRTIITRYIAINFEIAYPEGMSGDIRDPGMLIRVDLTITNLYLVVRCRDGCCLARARASTVPHILGGLERAQNFIAMAIRSGDWRDDGIY